MNKPTHFRPTVRLEAKQRWSFAASLTSIISAFIASMCCVGPLVFAILGIGGAGLLVQFEPYRPYFMVITFALLGTSFYLTYRKPKTTRLDAGDLGCECPSPNANRAGKVMLWVATALVAIFLALPYLAPLIFE